MRARLDPWLFAQAEQAGAQCLAGVQVDALKIENGAVCGVIVEGDVLLAKTVVIAEGANTLLAEQHLLVNKLPQNGVAVGVKEVLALPKATLENRFALENNEGTAWLCTGGICADLPAGGFLYTNVDALDWSTDLQLWKRCNLACSQVLDVVKPGEVLGRLTEQAARQRGLPAGIPAMATAHDKAIEALGTGTREKGVAPISLATYIGAIVHGDENL